MFEKEQIITTVCDNCGEINTESYKTTEDGIFPRPGFPEGWLRIQRQHLCPKHSVVVLVDGQIFLEVTPENA